MVPPVRISYFTDLLCIWAYVGNRRVEQLVRTFGDAISIDAHFCSVFPDAHGKIAGGWKDRGGFEGYHRHVRGIAETFPHVEVNENIWLDPKPRSSAGAHMFVKAIEVIEAEDLETDQPRPPYLERLSTRAAWELRCAFFVKGRDISDWSVHEDIAAALGVDYNRINAKIRCSEAITQLELDYSLGQKHDVRGSPTYIMNEGRQKLFGNVGYRLIEANVQEILQGARANEASWC